MSTMPDVKVPVTVNHIEGRTVYRVVVAARTPFADIDAAVDNHRMYGGHPYIDPGTINSVEETVTVVAAYLVIDLSEAIRAAKAHGYLVRSIKEIEV